MLFGMSWRSSHKAISIGISASDPQVKAAMALTCIPICCRPRVLGLRQAGSDGVVIGGRLAPNAAPAAAAGPVPSTAAADSSHAHCSPLPSTSLYTVTEAAAATRDAEQHSSSSERGSTETACSGVQQKEQAAGAQRWGSGVPVGFLNRNKSWPIGHAPQVGGGLGKAAGEGKPGLVGLLPGKHRLTQQPLEDMEGCFLVFLKVASHGACHIF